ncbi:MAG: alpha/beta hydrolase [Pseudomonadota bacterium]
MDWNSGERTTIRAGGKQLEAVAFGPSPKDAPTIVLLHEGLGCVSLWRDFPERLSEKTGWGVFVYSRAGYGASDPADLPRPLDYMTREAVDVLPDVLAEIGFEKGVLLGHSDGASIAALYGGTVEDLRIRGLILIAPHFFTEDAGLTSIAEAKSAYETGDLKEKLARHHDHVDNAFKGWNDAWLDPEFRDWNIGATIDHLRIPVMGIQGRDDQYGSMAQLDELETRLYSPFDRVEIEGCQHAPYLEKPEETLAAAAEFVTRLQRIESTVVPIKAVGQ